MKAMTLFRKSREYQWGRCLPLLFLPFLLESCTDYPHLKDPLENVPNIKETMWNTGGGWTRASATLIQKGMKAALQGNILHASKEFHQAVKYDPTNSYAHFLNGYLYHLQGLMGDPERYQLAEVGYQLALQLDASNLLAAEQLGRLYLAMHEYGKAQDIFALGLLSDPTHPEFILGLVTASYLAQDLGSAIAALRAGERVISDRPEFLRLAALVYAAAGETEMANSYVQRYTGPDQARLRSRIARWDSFYRNDPSLKTAQDSAIAAAGNMHYLGALSDYMNTCSSGDVIFVGTPEEQATADAVKKETKDAKKKGDAPKPDFTNATVVVDVMMIIASEVVKGSRGINLLDTLSLVATGKYGVSMGDNTQTGSPSSSSSTSTSTSPTNLGRQEAWQYALSLPAAGVTYSLDLANDVFSEYQVKAKPSLIAMHGQTSKFFSGTHLKVLPSSTFGSGQMQPVDIGITLNITPTFLDTNRVKLNIVAQRDLLPGTTSTLPDSVLNSQNFYIETDSSSVTADVDLEFGQTLVLSGMVSLENSYASNSAPVLRSMSIFGDLFNQANQREVRRSVIFLVTPRKPHKVYNDGQHFFEQPDDNPDSLDQPNLKQLKKQFNTLFSIAPSARKVFVAVANPLYQREFNPLDVNLRAWENPEPAPYVFMKSYPLATS